MSQVKAPKKPAKKSDELDKAIIEIHKSEGNESIRVGLTSGITKCDVIPTGVLAIDRALGVGGVPRGRVIEIYGPESSGKTTLALTIVANAQKAGGAVAYIDAENALDSEYAQNLGVNLDDLLFSQPDSAEQAFRICEKLVMTNKVDVVVVDSVAAMVPEKELNAEIGESKIGALAAVMSTSLRKLSGILRKNNTCLIFINQVREKIGGMIPGQESTPGGRALKFYASMRLDIRRIGSQKDKNNMAIANDTRLKVVKNKVAPPFRLAEFDIIFGKGCNVAGSLLKIGSEIGIVEKSGSNYAYEGNRLGIGYSQACDFLTEHPEMLQELDAKLRAIVFSKTNLETPVSSSTEEGEDSEGVEEE
jgi:recombination protein RecA